MPTQRNFSQASDQPASKTLSTYLLQMPQNNTNSVSSEQPQEENVKPYICEATEISQQSKEISTTFTANETQTLNSVRSPDQPSNKTSTSSTYTFEQHTHEFSSTIRSNGKQNINT